MSKLTPTPEQEVIIEQAKANESFKISAGAGTGKSSTLSMIANDVYGKKKGQYLAFNKSIADDFQKKVSKNLQCNTFHSLAYRESDSDLLNKLRAKRAYGWDVAKTLNLNGMPVAVDFEFRYKRNGQLRKPQLDRGSVGNIVLATINKFCQSADMSINNSHVVHYSWIDESSYDAVSNVVVPAAIKWFNDYLCNPNKDIAIDHGIYLKLWQMNNPIIPMDYILVDECQDSNPLYIDIVKRQNCPIIAVGDSQQMIYCQPKGTKISVSKQISANRYLDEKVNIEDLKIGDKVMSYNLKHRHLHTSGKEITRIGSKIYTGSFVNVECGDNNTTFTHDHICLARMDKQHFKGKYVVYLMQRDNMFRVGISPFVANNQNSICSIQRARAEKADKMWWLELVEGYDSARMLEEKISYEYRIPQYIWEDNNTHRLTKRETNIDPHHYWLNIDFEKYMDIERLFMTYNLYMDEPVWSPTIDRCLKGRKSCPNFNSLFEIKACNLMNGMLMYSSSSLTDDSGKRLTVHSNLPLDGYRQIKVNIERVVNQEVWSFDVKDNQTYFADGILTHNCWNGALDSLKIYEGATHYLTKSFRFGQEVADEANFYLDYLDAEFRIQGNENRKSHIANIPFGNALLCRSNAGAMQALIKGQMENPNKTFALNMDTNSMISLLSGLDKLKYEGYSSHYALIPFDSYNDLSQLIEDGCHDAELIGAFNMHKMFGTKKIKAAIDQATGKKSADIIITTAHKSKGLEWNSVKINDDFKVHDGVMDDEEFRLAYVAVTRAKTVLDKSGLQGFEGYINDFMES